MNNHSLSDKLAALAVVVLLILTAWGNAVVMLAVAALGLAVTMLPVRNNVARGGPLAATVGFVLAIGLALILLLR
jgi:hypothetical protein